MSDDLFRDLDPAREYTAWTALRIVYDGLVGLRRTSRPAGLELVPDLAVALPRISQDGRTYAFTLRRGITYSDGRPLRPDDVRRGLERAFTANADPQTADGHPEYYAGIVGGRACLAKPATCSLRDGVETNPRANTVTIHLTEPDPDFLYKLSLTFATVAPPDAPMTAAGDRPLVGTGPYMIGEVTDPDGYGTSDAEHGKVTKQGLTLVRNPKFKQWSSVAQPWGYPDVIRWQPINPNDALAAVDHGDIDIFAPYVPAGDTQDEFVARLGALYGGRFHEDTTGFTFSVHMNTAVPPFDNLKARQAFTYALDRLKLADDLDLRVQTCQLVPPDYPGYRQRCPYSTSRDEAAWRGPDTETAKALSRDLGSAGRVTILSTSLFTKAEHELARTLQLLGYEPKTVELPPGKFFDVIYQPSSEPSIWIAGWAPDFPSASQYYGEFGCNLTLPAACDEKFAQLLSQANLAQRSDPAHAQTLWEDIYTRAAEQALLVPFARDTRMVIVSSRANPSFMWSWDGDLLVDQMWVR